MLVAGAGPAGLTLALDLLRRGVRVLLVERATALFPGSRGKGLQPRTREVLDDLGVGKEIEAAGGPYPRMRTWRDGEPGEEWDMAERTGPEPGAPYHDGWMVPQWRTQEVLYGRLRELGGEVVFGAALTGLDQDADGVTARLTGADGAAIAVRARWLVGADGGRSTVRRALGVGMTGETVDPAPMLVADVRLTDLDRDNWHIWPDAPGGGIALCPLAGTDHFQLAARFTGDGSPATASPSAPATASDAPAPDADTSPEAVRALIAARTHLAPAQVTEVLWASGFRARAAMADRFRQGRVFLTGDAAHVHSPAGGQGLNTSVQDAYNLGWKLGQVLRHGAPDALLDSYEEERAPVAAGVLGLSTRIHRAGHGGATEGARRGKETNQLALGYREGPLAFEGRTAPDGTLRAGDRVPDARCVTGGGEQVRLFDLLRGPHFTLLARGGATLPRIDADAHLVHAHTLAELDEHGAAAYGTAPGLFLIRPDGYLGATGDTALPSGALERFGLAPGTRCD
ncbi:FAD-dependent oxidoreductase [Streptomyces daliensis]